MALLSVEGVTVRFGGNLALDDVGFEVAPGRITGLIGPNGAGKTTVFNVITGLQDPDAGRVLLGEEDITRVPPHRRSQRGLARTFQRLELFGSLSARENLMVAAEIKRKGQRHEARPEARVQAVVERVGLAAFAEHRADELTTGQARLVELARALVTEPRVLLLDEPASGLDAEETEAFAALLRTVVADGTSLLLVEHDMPLVMQVCDHIYVLDHGSIIAEGSPAEIQRNQTVLDAYLGPTHEEVDA